LPNLIEEIRAEVAGIASERNLTEDRAFGYWFLEGYEDLSAEDAEDTITDGPWDRGRDAIYEDEDEGVLRIYQFKYSEDISYVRTALEDLQTGLIAEESRLPRFREVSLVVVTIAAEDPELHEAKAGVERRIKRWLRRGSYATNCTVEIVDRHRFLELAERIYGVDLSLEWKPSPILDESSIIGLVNAAGLKDWVTRDELFSFNIRRFLGIRKGSVSWKIKQSLEDEERRPDFWVLNNGIVCLCTSFQPPDGNVISFTNFTIVNGAQTVNAISKFLEENPTVTEPIWVIAKVQKVAETEIERAALITEASNTQNPTSTRDLRATDIVHKRIEEWLEAEFGINYVYKRGQRGSNPVKMKDLAQGWVSFWQELPNVSFARPGTIFSDDNIYGDVFPAAEVGQLRQSGTRAEVRNFLLRRLIAWKITVRTRKYLKENTGEGTDFDKKFRSLTYHMTWLYREMLRERMGTEEISSVYQAIDGILDITLPSLFGEVHSFLSYTRAEIPRELKSTLAQSKFREAFIPTEQYARIKRQVVA